MTIDACSSVVVFCGLSFDWASTFRSQTALGREGGGTTTVIEMLKESPGRMTDFPMGTVDGEEIVGQPFEHEASTVYSSGITPMFVMVTLYLAQPMGFSLFKSRLEAFNINVSSKS